MSSLVSSLCILALLLNPLAAPFARAQLTANGDMVTQAAKTLADCYHDKQNGRQLAAQVLTGMTNEIASKSKPCMTTKDPVFELAKKVNELQKAIGTGNGRGEGGFNPGAQKNFASDLHTQILKDAVMSYRDAELRYQLDDKFTIHKVKTLAEDFCGKNDGKCVSEISSTINSYDASFRALPPEDRKTYTPETARTALNLKLAKVNVMYQDYEKQKVAAQANQDRAELQATKNATKNYRGPAGGVAPVNDTVGGNIQANLKQGAAAAKRKHELEMDQAVRAQFEREEAREGVGLLLFSESVKTAVKKTMHGNHGGYIPSSDAVKTAITDIKKNTLELAGDVNDVYQDLLSNNKSPEDAIKELVKYNPVAAGQVLANHPDAATARMICKAIVSIEAKDRSDRKWGEILQKFAYGVAIIGGVLAVTGVLSLAGVAVEGIAGAISALATIESGLSIATLVASTGYTAYREINLHKDMTHEKNAIAANTNNNRELIEEQKKEADQLVKDLGKTVAFVLGGAALGKFGGVMIKRGMASRFLTKSELGEKFSALAKQVANNPKAAVMIDVTQRTCMLADVVACQVALATIQKMPLQKQKEILSDPNLLKGEIDKAAAEVNVAKNIETNQAPPVDSLPKIADGPPNYPPKSAEMPSLTEKANQSLQAFDVQPTKKELDLIYDVHTIGRGKPGKVEGTWAWSKNYKWPQLMAKRRQLVEGFVKLGRTREQAEKFATKLLEDGVCGDNMAGLSTGHGSAGEPAKSEWPAVFGKMTDAEIGKKYFQLSQKGRLSPEEQEFYQAADQYNSPSNKWQNPHNVVVAPVKESAVEDLSGTVKAQQDTRQWTKNKLAREEDELRNLYQHNPKKSEIDYQEAQIKKAREEDIRQRQATVRRLSEDLKKTDYNELPAEQRNWIKSVFDEENRYQNQLYDKEYSGLKFELNSKTGTKKMYDQEIEKYSKQIRETSDKGLQETARQSRDRAAAKSDAVDQEITALDHKIKELEQRKPAPHEIPKVTSSP